MKHSSGRHRSQQQELEQRYLGCLIGLAVGDAIGTTVEFAPRGSFAPLTDMTGGGPFGLAAGEWTDDTSMALCLAHSLVYRGGFDPTDQMNRYCNWANHGYMSCTGRCFDIGNTVATALRKYQVSGDPFSGSTDPRTAGNGSIMRLAPVPMFYAASREATLHYCGESSRTTHGAPEAIEAARLFGVQLRLALLGESKQAILTQADYDSPVPSVAAMGAGGYRDKPERDIRGSGYVIHSLEAALWCFLHTGSYAEAVLKAANLGEDADTTAAICGQLAGAHYAVEAIPQAWRDKLAMREDIERLALQLLTVRPESHGDGPWPIES